MQLVRLSGLALMNIHYEKPVDNRDDAVVQLFAERYPRRIPSLTKHKIEKRSSEVYFYHSFINANLNQQ